MRQVPTECGSSPAHHWSGGHSPRQVCPISIIVTTIQRNQDLVEPVGSTTLEAGDELVLIGRSDDIDAIRTIASGVRPGGTFPRMPIRRTLSRKSQRPRK